MPQRARVYSWQSSPVLRDRCAPTLVTAQTRRLDSFVGVSALANHAYGRASTIASSLSELGCTNYDFDGQRREHFASNSSPQAGPLFLLAYHPFLHGHFSLAHNSLEQQVQINGSARLGLDKAVEADQTDRVLASARVSLILSSAIWYMASCPASVSATNLSNEATIRGVRATDPSNI